MAVVRMRRVSQTLCAALVALLLFAAFAAAAVKVTPAMQLDPALGQSFLSVKDQVLVAFAPTVSPQDAALIGGKIACRVAGEVPGINGYVFDLPAGRTVPEVLNWFRKQPEVRYAQLNYIYHLTQFTPNDPFYTQQYHLPLINCPLAWELIGNMPGNSPQSPQIGDPSIIIGIVDSGVQLAHPDLAPLMWVNTGEIPGNGIDDDGNGYVDDVNGWDHFDNDNDPNPTQGGGIGTANNYHGTAVAGLAGAVGNNAVGVAGVSWNCTIMAVKAFPDDGSPSTTAVLVNAVQYAINNGCDVVNMSFGGPGQDTAMEQTLISGFTAVFDRGPGLPQRVGVVQVAAAGNTGTRFDRPKMDTPVHSEQNDEVIGVAAIDQQGVRASFSNYGPVGVDIATYGVGMISTLLDDPASTTDIPYGNAGDGTSFAAPLVSGAAAVLRAINPSLSAEAVRDILYQAAENSADQLYSANPTLEPLKELGHGPLDLATAVQIVQQAPPHITVTFPATGERIFNTTPKVRITIRKAYPGAPDITSIRVAVGRQERGQTIWRPDIYFTGTSLDSKTIEFQIGDPQAGDDMTGTAFEEAQAQGRAANLPLVVSDAGSTTYAIRVIVSQEGTEDHEQTTTFRVSSVAMDAGLHMFSVPYDLGAIGLGENKSYDDVFRRPDIVFGLPVDSPGGSFVARYDPEKREYVRTDVAGSTELSALELGKGYWVMLQVPVPRLTIRGQRAEGTTPVGAPPGIPLMPGWHQIGLPFPFSVPVAALAVDYGGVFMTLSEAVDQGLLRGAFYAYNTASGYYEAQVLPDGVLEPFKGYWVRILQPVQLLVQPVQATGLGSVVIQSAPREGWVAQIVASAGGAEDRANFIGVAPKATTGFDLGYDLEEPPPFDSRVVLSFRPCEGEVFSRDIRGPVTDRQVWNVEVRCAAPRQKVSLRWDDLRQVPRDLALYLVDEETGRVLSMRSVGGYTFVSGEAGSVRRLKIVAERRGYGGRLFSVQMLPVQATRGGRATVAFRLSEGATVDCVIRNAAGRIIRHVVREKTCPAGVTTLVWDGRSDAGTVAPPGRYLVEVIATSERMERATGVRTVVKQ